MDLIRHSQKSQMYLTLAKRRWNSSSSVPGKFLLTWIPLRWLEATRRWKMSTYTRVSLSSSDNATNSLKTWLKDPQLISASPKRSPITWRWPSLWAVQLPLTLRSSSSATWLAAPRIWQRILKEVCLKPSQVEGKLLVTRRSHFCVSWRTTVQTSASNLPLWLTASSHSRRRQGVKRWSTRRLKSCSSSTKRRMS